MFAHVAALVITLAHWHPYYSHPFFKVLLSVPHTSRTWLQWGFTCAHLPSVKVKPQEWSGAELYLCLVPEPAHHPRVQAQHPSAGWQPHWRTFLEVMVTPGTADPEDSKGRHWVTLLWWVWLQEISWLQPRGKCPLWVPPRLGLHVGLKPGIQRWSNTRYCSFFVSASGKHIV